MFGSWVADAIGAQAAAQAVTTPATPAQTAAQPPADDLPPLPPVQHTAWTWDFTGLQRLERARRAAVTNYPGAIGEYLAHELELLKTEKMRFCAGSRPHRLIDALLAQGQEA